ncbi:MAG TPA: Ig-like domain-containing protein [Gemmatimonadaceae bacterium]|nr:Ig-like domain-containing protein [Gemmatimonadaceae bacterium]
MRAILRSAVQLLCSLSLGAAVGCGGGGEPPLLSTGPTNDPVAVTIALPAKQLPIGAEVQATATVYDAAGHPVAATGLTWSSTETTVALVSDSGMVKAVGPGSAMIRATIKNVSGGDSVVVLAPPPPPPPVVASVAISLSDSSLTVGESAEGRAIAKDSSGAVVDGQVVVWAIDSGATIASVSSTGVVRALAAGTAIVRAAVGAVSSTVTITIAAAPPPPPPRVVASLSIAIGLTTLQVGQATQAVAVAKDSAGAVITGEVITWSVDSGATVVSISTSGVVNALAAGSARIKATAGTVSALAVITVVVPPPPPPVSATSVPLMVSRLTAGAGSVLVSNAVPLMPGMLTVSGLVNVLVKINDVEVPISVTPTAGAHKDGSLRSIVVQFQYDVPPTGIAATLQLGTVRSQHMSAQPIPSMPDAVALPTDPTYLIATELVGPTISQATSKAMGASWLKYENDFVTFADKHWTTYGFDWASTNYYDRVQIYYAWWVRTGNPEFWRRATLIAVNYRQKYLEPNNYASSHHWSQLEGLADHYWLTGDPASQRAVGRTADVLASYYRKGVLADTNHIDMESRIQARSLQAMLLAWEIQAPGGGTYTPSTWATHLPLMLGQILRAQNSTGAFKWGGYCRTSINYMNGLLNDVMIRYHERFAADPRILPSIQANADWLWTNQWRQDQSFNYQSAFCARNNSGPGQSVDLNGLYVTTYSWLYKQTGQASYLQAADAIFASGVNRSYLTGDKQFNQEYTASYKYLFYRR